MCTHEAGGDQKEAGVNRKDEKLGKIEVEIQELRRKQRTEYKS